MILCNDHNQGPILCYLGEICVVGLGCLSTLQAHPPHYLSNIASGVAPNNLFVRGSHKVCCQPNCHLVISH